MGLIAAGVEANVTDRPGGIFVRPGDQISDEDRILIQSVARVIIADSRGTLADQIERRSVVEAPVPLLAPTRNHRTDPPPATTLPSRDLIFFNGLGGFTPDGREYVITTSDGQTTPAPWVNVLANPNFGTVVSESGLAYTWGENAHEFRLTPWSDDPVSDSGGEALYLRDEESGYFWSPTPLPKRGAGVYISRHGFGYSVFEHTEGGIHSELWVYVALDASVKFSVLKVRNESGRTRRLSATGYVEWVLGDLRPKSSMHVITEIDPASGALFARNPYNTEFTDRVAFFDVDDGAGTVSGDRAEFLGRNGTPRTPAAMMQSRLSGIVGAGLDPCAAMQVPFELADGARAGDCLPSRRRPGRRGREQPGAPLPGFHCVARRARSGVAVLEAHARCGACGNPRPIRQCPGQRLAPLSDSRLPFMGAERILPVWGRVWLPRSIAGRDGPCPHRAAPGARALNAVRDPPVPGGRCPALVASSLGPGRPNTLLG